MTLAVVENDATTATPGNPSTRSVATAATAASSDCSVFHGDYCDCITEKYRPKKIVLGEGSFGVVRECVNKTTGEICALKTIDKSKLDDPTQLKREVDILLHVDHPHIIKLYDVYEDGTVSSIHFVFVLFVCCCC